MFGSLFESDIVKLRKGKLKPEKAIRLAFDRLEKGDCPLAIYEQEQQLLRDALMLVPIDMFVPILIVKPQIVAHLNIHVASAQMIDRLHHAYLILRQANANKENPQLWPCINILRSIFMARVIREGQPLDETDGWHRYWWDELKDEFFEANLTIDFCPKCGMDASLSDLELSKRYNHSLVEDPRIWSIVCCECGNILQRFSADQGGQTNIREISL